MEDAEMNKKMKKFAKSISKEMFLKFSDYLKEDKFISPQRVLPGRFMGSVTLGEHKSVQDIIEAIGLKRGEKVQIYRKDAEFYDKIKLNEEKKEIGIWEASVSDLFGGELITKERLSPKDFGVTLAEFLNKALSYGFGLCPIEAFMLVFLNKSSVRMNQIFLCATTPIWISFGESSIFSYSTANSLPGFRLIPETGIFYKSDWIFYLSGPKPRN
jgi:hypothetical protein